MSDLSLKNIRKSYANLEVLHGIDLDITSGEFIVFVGPSGCGKSTLLRSIAGLETITSGDLVIAGERMNNVAPSKRGISMVFQSYALYPHMTVYENMAFGLRIAGVAKAEIDKRVKKAGEILQLTAYLQRLPKALSVDRDNVLRLDVQLLETRVFSCLTNPCPILMQPCGWPHASSSQNSS